MAFFNVQLGNLDSFLNPDVSFLILWSDSGDFLCRRANKAWALAAEYLAVFLWSAFGGGIVGQADGGEGSLGGGEGSLGGGEGSLGGGLVGDAMVVSEMTVMPGVLSGVVAC